MVREQLGFPVNKSSFRNCARVLGAEERNPAIEGSSSHHKVRCELSNRTICTDE